jgi:hypothetical protein
MSSQGIPQAATNSEVVRSIWDRIRARLEAERHRIHEEIRSYPRPIAACDQQFNFLLEQRARVAEEWQEMEQRCARSLAANSPGACRTIPRGIKLLRRHDSPAISTCIGRRAGL